MKAYYYQNQIHESSFVKKFAKALNMPTNLLHAESMLCTFFQTIREHIPLFASRALISHLPSEVRTVYKNGWHREFSSHFDYDKFIERLYSAKGMEHLNVFCSKAEVEAAVSAVFEVLKERLTEKQYADLMSYMPLVLRVNLMHDYHIDGQSCIV